MQNLYPAEGTTWNPSPNRSQGFTGTQSISLSVVFGRQFVVVISPCLPQYVNSSLPTMSGRHSHQSYAENRTANVRGFKGTMSQIYKTERGEFNSLNKLPLNRKSPANKMRAQGPFLFVPTQNSGHQACFSGCVFCSQTLSSYIHSCEPTRGGCPTATRSASSASQYPLALCPIQ